MTVVADVADGITAVAQAKELTPQVCLVDVRMPGLDGLEVTRRLAPHTRVVVVTTFDTDQHLYTALDNGACGFLTKDASPGLLVEGVEVCRARRRSRVAPSGPAAAAAWRPRSHGSRDLSVECQGDERGATPACRGLGNQEIADSLHVSLSSVKTYLASVQGKSARATAWTS